MNASSLCRLTSGCARRSVRASVMRPALIHSNAVPAACPSAETLDAFLDGKLPSPTREEVAAHISECPRCAGRIGQVVARISISGPTHFDSPAAFRRRISATTNPAVELTSTSNHDTYISEEKVAPSAELGKG